MFFKLKIISQRLSLSSKNILSELKYVPLGNALSNIRR